MKPNNNNLSPLPFYDSLNEQNARKSYAYGDIYPLFADGYKLLPFQIIRQHSNNLNIGTCWLKRKDGYTVDEIRTNLIDGGLTIFPFKDDNFDVIVYPGNLLIFTNPTPGIYYIELNDVAGNTFYSEMFTIVTDMQPYLKLEWWDLKTLPVTGGAIIYEHMKNYRNRLYFCAEIGKPDYDFTEEGEDRDGYFFREKQLSEKKYRFNILAPEYLCDVMRLIRMADYVLITDKYGREYICTSFLITPKWQTQGNLASVECEFTTSTVIKKIGRGIDIYDITRGDFNIDFNNDYNNY